MERSVNDQRAYWAFWIACGLTAAGALAPLVLGGGSRVGIVYGYVVAALALGACALLYDRGRPIATLLYFVGGLAINYGILSMLTLPLRLAVVGTCPPDTAGCTLGLERPLTVAETSSLELAIGLGIVALVTGFFGLRLLYRRKSAAVLPSAPPERRIAPVVAQTPAAPPAPPAPQAAAAPAPAEPEPAAELDELPAPAEVLELPAPTPEEAAEPNIAAQPSKPRRRRTPKVAADHTPPTRDAQ